MTVTTGQDGLDLSVALDKYANMVRRICFLHLRQREDVEDVFQDVFLKYLLRDKPFDSDEHEKAWLLRVAINQCRDVTKSFWHNRIDPLEANMLSVMPPESQYLLAEVLKLPPAERNAVYLHYYEGYSVPEIARVQNLNANTVYSHIHRARKRLKKRLGGESNEKTNEEGL